MNTLKYLALIVFLTLLPSQVFAQRATVRVPTCLIYPDSNSYAPCTGVVPVDSSTGNPLRWQDLFSNNVPLVSDPTSTVTINSTTVPTKASLTAGWDGTTIRTLAVDTSGRLIISPSTGGSTVTVSNFPATQAVSVVSLPLPTGAATAANQTTSNTSLGSIDTKLTGVATAANQTVVQSAPGTSATTALTVQGSANGVAIPVDTVIRLTATDRGALITTAGTPQQLMDANTSRRGFAIQNQSTGACYINGQASAIQDYRSLLIPAGGFYDTPTTHVGTGAISIVCAVANAPVYAREW